MDRPDTPTWIANDEAIAGRLPRIMAVVNVTPDSFSDGGRHVDVDDALRHARSLVDDGADILDVGGESSRPGAEVVDPDEELRRVVPAVRAIARAMPRVPISVDTTKPEVAVAALEAGASILNDISGLRDPRMMRVAAESNCGLVLMHMPGDPRTMAGLANYADVVEDVLAYLADRVEAAETAGIDRGRIAIDPGIGFGKTTEHNLSLLRNLPRFATLGCAVMVGTSRKGFLGKVTGRPVESRATASVVSSLAAILGGASVVRVHDVGPMADALKVWEAVHGWGEAT